MEKPKKVEIEDACPFPPGVNLPRTTGLSQIPHSIRIGFAPPIGKVVIFASVILVVITFSAMYVGWVNQLNSGLPLVSTLVTDQDQYQVGEYIRATLLYVNPNQQSVSFKAPSHALISFHEWPLSSLSRPLNNLNENPEESIGIARIDPVALWFVVGPNEKVTLFSYTFTATRVGTFLVTIGDISKQIQIIG